MAPTNVEAGFISDLFSSEVSAQSNVLRATENSKNSQTMGILQATVSSATVIQEKAEKAAAKSKAPASNTAGAAVFEVKEDESVSILSNNALVPVATPTDLSPVADFEEFSSQSTSVYVVRSGDTISQVATMFGVTPDTILSVNGMQKGEKLKEGDVLLILPFSGVEHTVAKNQTLQGIANLYKVDIDEILLANDLDADAKLVIGAKLMVPGAGMLVEPPVKTGSGTITKGGSSAGSSKYFINPVPGSIKSRGIKPGHMGVDLAAPTGTPIKAAAAGTVIIARNGHNGGFGNYVVIQHGNGTKTLYAHMSRLGTSAGAKVSQGQVIGYVGSTGRSTGPHLHIEVLGGKNPF